MTTQELAALLVEQYGSRRVTYLCLREEPDCIAWRDAQPYSREQLKAVGEHLLWNSRSGATDFNF